MFNKIKLFLGTVFIEYRKVAWPNRSQVISTTILVLMLVLIMSIYVGTIDFFLKIIVGIFLGR